MLRKIKYTGRFLVILQMVLRVVLSYVILDFIAKFRDEKWKEGKTKKLHNKNAQMIFDTIIYLEGVLIKAGQFMSTRADIMPPEYVAILSKLQDQVPQKPREVIQKRLREELGDDWEDNFTSFSPDAIAAASLGQVHDATLKNGDRVAVKIQYPGIEELVKADLAILAWNMRNISARRFKDFPFENIIKEARNFLIEELDYIREGKNAEAIKKTVAPMNGEVVVPSIYWDFTTKTVLTMEFIDGVKISDVKTLDGVDREKVSSLVAESLVRQILIDGLFHADPHGGNVMILPDSRIAFIDFGLAKKIDPHLRKALRRVTKAILVGDDEELGAALIEAGFKTRDGNPNTTKLISYAMLGYLKGGKKTFLTKEEIDEKVRAIPNMMRKNPVIEFPKDFVLVGRVLALLAGLASIIQAETDIAGVILKVVKAAEAEDGVNEQKDQTVDERAS